jgi:hypothetical protein
MWRLTRFVNLGDIVLCLDSGIHLTHATNKSLAFLQVAHQTQTAQDDEKQIPIFVVVQISQGAEAKVWSTTFLQRDTIIKQRFSKQYRHPALDATLTMQRLKAEVRCMIRARKLGVLTPVPYFTEVQAASIYMERINGVTVKHVRAQNTPVLGGTAAQLR